MAVQCVRAWILVRMGMHDWPQNWSCLSGDNLKLRDLSRDSHALPASCIRITDMQDELLRGSKDPNLVRHPGLASLPWTFTKPEVDNGDLLAWPLRRG